MARDASQRFAASKISRCQLGVELHKEWLKDLVKTCGKKCMLVNDFHHGSAEVLKACLDVKISDEATAQGVRACAWSRDPRSVFFEAGRARGRTHMGNLYLKRKLTLAGHQPVDDPGPKPKKSRKMVKAFMTRQLKVLSLSADGDLIIPGAAEAKAACNATFDDEAAKQLEQWRKQYPRPKQPTALETQDTTDPKPDEPTNPTEVVVKAGTCFPNEDEMTSKSGEHVVKLCTLPPVQAAIYKKAELVLCAKPGSGACHRVWMHHVTSSDISWPTGMYLGEGGPGAFISVATNALAEEQKPYAWRWTRITSHKRDSAEIGNAFMSYIADVRATSLADGKPKLHTMEDIEMEVGSHVSLYGHAVTRGAGAITPASAPVVYVPTNCGSGSPESFSHKVLGNWLPSQESATGTTVTLDGYARPVFEVVSAASTTPGAASSATPQPSKVIKPMNIAARNSMHIFSSRKMDIPANGWFALH